MRVSPWIAAVVLMAACRSRETRPEPQATAPRDAAVVSASDAAVATTDAGADVPSPAIAALRSEGAALLARWLEAQNRGDVAAYNALYERTHFKGVKRTADGKVRTYDGAGWAKDRARMLAKGMEVAAEELAVETWLDDGSTLKDGVISLRFLQRWRGGGYADHGIKILQAWKSARGGWLIVYEDLLNAEPGWERAIDATAPLALAVPADDAAALALWKQVAPTGADYEDKLAAIPPDPAIRRPMARALLTEGNFVCTKVIDAGACGEVILEFEPLSPKAALGDPCLGRRLALWAVEQLEPADVPALKKSLVVMAGLAPPETELPKAAFDVIPDGDDALRLALLDAAAGGKGPELHALAEEESAALVGEPAILEAATRLSLDAAVDRLDRARYRVQLLTALADDDLEVLTRARILRDYAADKGKDVGQALVAMTRHADCSLAMLAASILADRGVPSHLPQRPPTSGSDDDLRRALCMIAHDDDEARRATRWTEMLAPKVIQREVVQRDFDDSEPDSDPSPTDEDAPSGTIVTRGGGPGAETNTWDTVDRDAVGLDGDFRIWAGCPGGVCEATPYELVIARDSSGRRWITEIIQRRWEGCPC